MHPCKHVQTPTDITRLSTKCSGTSNEYLDRKYGSIPYNPAASSRSLTSLACHNNTKSLIMHVNMTTSDTHTAENSAIDPPARINTRSISKKKNSPSRLPIAVWSNGSR